jgi:hypothetical protein
MQLFLEQQLSGWGSERSEQALVLRADAKSLAVWAKKPQYWCLLVPRFVVMKIGATAAFQGTYSPMACELVAYAIH